MVAERLDEQRAILQAVLDTAAEGIIVIDSRGIIQSVNAAGLGMFGYGAEELLGQNVSILMPSPHREIHDGYMLNYLHTGKAKIIGIGREVEGQRKDGTIFPLGLAISEVSLPGRRLFTGIVRDLTERREAESRAQLRLHELAHAARLLELGEMTSGLSHEINQPLTAIVAYAQACRRLLSAEDADHQMLQETMDEIVQQGERAAEIIKSLRAFARKHDDQRQQVELNTVVREVLVLLDHEMRRGGVQTEVTSRVDELNVQASRIQIEQVLVNLIRNAIQAMEIMPRGHRQLRLRLETVDETWALVSVTDSGPGISPDAMSRLFESYFTTKDDGMGVGLAISKSIADAHKGRLSADNEPGMGAVFRLELPLDTHEEAGQIAGG